MIQAAGSAWYCQAHMTVLGPTPGIPDYTFYDATSRQCTCPQMSSVTISQGARLKIGQYAFYSCSNIVTLTMPADSVTNIGSHAFMSCSNLATVTMPDSITSIGAYAFEECGNLKTVHIGNAVKSITSVSAAAFVSACNRALDAVRGIALSSKGIDAMSCHLTDMEDADGETRPRRFRIVDKHGLSRYAYNLEIEIDLAGEVMTLGLDPSRLPGRSEQAASPPVQSGASTEELIDDLSSLLKKRGNKTITEE